MNPQDDNAKKDDPKADGGAPPPAQGVPTPPPAQGVPTPPPAQGVPTPPPAQGVPTPPPAQGVPTPPPAQGVPPMPPAGYPPQGAPMPPAGYPQQGAPMPPAGYPQQGAPMPPGVYPPAAGAPVPPAQPEDTTPANFQLGTKLPKELSIKAPENELNFDGDYFIRLLAGSISLSREEKKKIIESIPKLKQGQIDELIRIFEEEKQKFAALSKKHAPQLEKLADQHYNDWMDLEAEMKHGEQKKEDDGKADEIRKQLGV